MTWALGLQLAVYELMDVVPCALLTAAALQDKLRSRRSVVLAMAALYLLGIIRRLLLLRGASGALLSLVWIAFYLAACKLVVRTHLSKILFVLITMLNYASLVAVLYNYIGYQLFASRLEAFPYCFEASLTIFILYLLTLPFLYHLLVLRVRRMMALEENGRLWCFLWLVPATFCVFFYYNLYAGGGILAYSSHTQNLVYTAVIGAGGFFVLFLTIRMVEENGLILRLRIENDQLAMQSIHYENLQSRMDEARRARHDIRQCIAVIEAYLRDGDTEGLRSFAEYYLKMLPADTTLVYTHNAALNALIVYYAGLAAAQNTAFEVQVDYPRVGPIVDVDLAVLFGNLLENAVEACSRQQKGPRRIHLIFRPEQGAFVILLTNTCAASPEPQGEQFRSSKREGLGMGVISIRRIAEKYHGLANFEYDAGSFCVSILLNP